MSSIAVIRSLVSSDILRDTNFRVRPQATVDRAINTAYKRVQQDVFGMIDADSEQSINWVAGIGKYNLATDLNFVEVVRRDGKPLTRTTRKQVAQQPTDSNEQTTTTTYEYLVDVDGNYLLDVNNNFLTIEGTQTTTAPLVPIGTPTSYYITNWQIGLYPRPETDGYITVTYSGVFPEVSDTQVLLTPAFLDPVIAYYTASILLKQVMKLDVAQLRENEYYKNIDLARLNLVKDENLVFLNQR